jgi:hypothetical protein
MQISGQRFADKKNLIYFGGREIKVITTARKKYVSNSDDDLSQERERGEAI